MKKNIANIKIFTVLALLSPFVFKIIKQIFYIKQRSPEEISEKLVLNDVAPSEKLGKPHY